MNALYRTITVSFFVSTLAACADKAEPIEVDAGTLPAPERSDASADASVAASLNPVVDASVQPSDAGVHHEEGPHHDGGVKHRHPWNDAGVDAGCDASVSR